jgi:hypothetical protein
MISVIIPTIWRSPYAFELIRYLNSIDVVGDIIVIDNDISRNNDLSQFSKVNHIKNETNAFVNPSWNQGVEVAKYDKLCIMNDDVILHEDVFNFMNHFISNEIGLVGISSTLFDTIKTYMKELEKPKHIRVQFLHRRNFGYGCCFFLHKESYIPLPDEMKIQYGDDYIFYTSTKNSYVLDGFTIVGKLSASMLDDNMNMVNGDFYRPICDNDHKVFWNHIDSQVLTREPINDFEKMKFESLKAYRAKSLTNYYF